MKKDNDQKKKKPHTKAELNKIIAELNRDLKHMVKDYDEQRKELKAECKKVTYLEYLCTELKSYIYHLEEEVPESKRKEMNSTYPDEYDINKINKYLNR